MIGLVTSFHIGSANEKEENQTLDQWAQQTLFRLVEINQSTQQTLSSEKWKDFYSEWLLNKQSVLRKPESILLLIENKFLVTLLQTWNYDIQFHVQTYIIMNQAIMLILSLRLIFWIYTCIYKIDISWVEENYFDLASRKVREKEVENTQLIKMFNPNLWKVSCTFTTWTLNIKILLMPF